MVLSNKMSTFRLWLLFFVTLIEVTIFSAPFLGWPSLALILKEEGIYSHLCPGHDESYSNISTPVTETSRRRYGQCVAQEERFNIGLNLSVLLEAVYTFICGWVIDRYGVKSVKIFSSVMIGTSAGLLAVTSAENSTMLIPSMLVLTIGFVGLFLSAMRSLVLYEKWQSSVNSVLCCAVSSSAVLFLVIKVLYDQGVSYQLLCYGLISSSLILLLNAIVIFPRNIESDNHDDDRMTKAKLAKENLHKVPTPNKSGLEGSQFITALKDFVVHMKSGVFVGSCLFIGMCRMRLWFFLSSFQQFMTALPKMNEESVKSYANYYGITQLCSVALGPLVGALITAAAEMSKRSSSYSPQVSTVTIKEKPADNCNSEILGMNDASAAARACEVRGCTVYFACSGILLLLINLLTVIPNAPLQILSFILMTLLRCFYTGGFSNLYLVVFPVKHFGKLYGIGNFICSLLKLLQFPIFVILENYFPGKILKFNIALLMLSIPIAVGFPYYLWHLGRTMDRKARFGKSTSHARGTKVIVERVVYERLTVL